jgi:general secretion pathway protein K
LSPRIPGPRRGARPHSNPRHQRGVALIIALILVALATILASKLSYEGFLERRRTIGVLAAEQAMHFAMGAEALAADVLVQDAQNSKQTTLAGAWAQPTQPLPITPQDDPEGEPIGTLQGELEDMMGRFNLNSLAHVIVDANQKAAQDPQPLAQFQRLLALVGVEPKWAAIARDWIDADDTPGSPDGAEDQIYTSQTPPYRTGNWPLMSPSELLNLPGFGADRYRKIAPYVTALPTAVPNINVCTASGPVLDSFKDGMSEYSSSPEVLTNGRKTGCFPDAVTLRAVLGATAIVGGQGAGAQGTPVNNVIVETSTYFRLTTHITLGTTEFTLYSLLMRGGNNGGPGGKVTPLLRSFGTP